MPHACRQSSSVTEPNHRKSYSRHKLDDIVDVNLTDIFVSKIRAARKHIRPIGFCVDIGSPRCVVGIKELNRIYHVSGRSAPELQRSHRKFKFGDMSSESLGTCFIPLATPPGMDPIMVEVDVVRAEIPALLGMNLLDKESLTP